MVKRSDNKSSILPLTTDDILGESRGTPASDRFSTISSMNSQSTLPSLSTYSQRQHHRSRLKKIRDNLNSRLTVPKYFKRMFAVKSLDFETAFWEMINLLINPKRVYKSSYYQKQTKNRWARDDPSFVIILCFGLIISAICWGLMYTTGFIGIFKLILYMVIVDFLLFGLVIATLGWIVANKYFLLPEAKQTENPNSNSNFPFISKYFTFNSILEWSYCFDIHCNAYLVIWLTLYFIQFFFLPLLRMNNVLSTLLGNTLYFFALSYYFLITFYGYNGLPFLKKTEYILLPIIAFIVLWITLTVFGFNMANYMCEAYFN